MEAVQGLGGLLTGYWLYHIFSKPYKLRPNRLPTVKFKLIEILPNLKINFKKKIIWIHHWIFLSILVFILFVYTASFTQLLVLKSFLVGGIIQGFTFKDRFKIILDNQ